MQIEITKKFWEPEEKWFPKLLIFEIYKTEITISRNYGLEIPYFFVSNFSS
jgi:hypothetical protein